MAGAGLLEQTVLGSAQWFQGLGVQDRLGHAGVSPWVPLQVDCLESALEKSLQAPELQVSILLDFTRGSRGW